MTTRATESSSSLLQKNVLDSRRRETLEERRLAIVTWIETTYSRAGNRAPWDSTLRGKLTHRSNSELIYTVARAA